VFPFSLTQKVTCLLLLAWNLHKFQDSEGEKNNKNKERNIKNMFKRGKHTKNKANFTKDDSGRTSRMKPKMRLNPILRPEMNKIASDNMSKEVYKRFKNHVI